MQSYNAGWWALVWIQAYDITGKREYLTTAETLVKYMRNTALLTTARSIATAGVARFNRNTVLYEGCEPNCTGDGQAFKGVFIRYLRALVKATATTEWDAFINTTANSILATNTNSAGQQGNSFVGPFALWSATTQAASAAALIAATNITPPAANLLRGHESGRCVDVPGASQTNSTRVALWDCNSGTNQRWVATGSRQLQVYGSKCLDVSGGSTTDGAAVLIYDCHAGTNQQWTVNADGTVVSVASGKCLDATGHGTANGTLLAVWTCNGGTNQRWSRS